MKTVKSVWTAGYELEIDDDQSDPDGPNVVVRTKMPLGGPTVGQAIVNRADLLTAVARKRERPTIVETQIEHWKERAQKAEAEVDLLRGDLDVTRTAFEDRNASMLTAMDERDAARTERDRLLATIERIDAVRRDFYEVRGDWADPEGAAALKAQMERAILGDPPFELPTKTWSGIVGTHHEYGDLELRLFPDGLWTHAPGERPFAPYRRWEPEDVPECFTGLRLVED